MFARRTFGEIFLIAAMLAFFAGCSNPFAPRQGEGKPEEPLKPPTSPENVMDNLNLAMNNKDIEIYKDCLDENYWYHSPPPVADEPPIDWPKDTDVKVVGKIFKAFDTFDFDLSLRRKYIETPKEASENAQHPGEDWVVFEYIVTMRLRRPESKGYSYNIYQIMEFKLRENSKGEWKIIRWIDYTEEIA